VSNIPIWPNDTQILNAPEPEDNSPEETDMDQKAVNSLLERPAPNDTLTLRAYRIIERWLEWARMHGHLEHAEGVVKDSRERWRCALSDSEYARPPCSVSESDRALGMIREATDHALDEAGLVEAVAVLISQRDNARHYAETFRAKLKELGHEFV